jgi:hypothetical protein
VSCNDTDDATGHSNLPVQNPVNATLITDFSTTVDNVVDEADEDVFTISVTLDKTQPVDIYLNVEQVGGTATNGVDFELSKVYIPANTLTGTGTISIFNDVKTEVTETLEVRIANLAANVVAPVQTATFTINNYLSDELHLDFKYNKSIQYGGAGGATITNTLCGILYDLDFYLLDASYSDTGDYQAAGSNCEEAMVLDASLADGTYYILPDLYDTGDVNGGANATNDGLNAIFHLPFKVALGIDYSKDGGIDAGSFAVNSIYHPTSTQSPAQYAAIANLIIKIEKSTVNGHAIFALSDADTNQPIASGRKAKVDFAKILQNLRKNNKK